LLVVGAPLAFKKFPSSTSRAHAQAHHDDIKSLKHNTRATHKRQKQQCLSAAYLNAACLCLLYCHVNTSR
jgi:hypothetical protein